MRKDMAKLTEKVEKLLEAVKGVDKKLEETQKASSPSGSEGRRKLVYLDDF